MRQAVTALDRNLPIYNVTTIQRYLDESTWGWRIFGTLFSVFGVAALFLATVGLYGVMAFSVSRRTQEIGVRMAVGAGAPDVLRMVLRQGALAGGRGAGPAWGFAVVPRRHAADVLPGEPFDPFTFVAVGVLLLATGLAAAFVPARRVARRPDGRPADASNATSGLGASG